jgi:hypothetical protein
LKKQLEARTRELAEARGHLSDPTLISLPRKKEALRPAVCVR